MWALVPTGNNMHGLPTQEDFLGDLGDLLRATKDLFEHIWSFWTSCKKKHCEPLQDVF